MANREMAHLRDDPEAGFGGATELVDSTVLLGGARSSLPNGGYELPEPSVSADASDDSLTTPLLVGEASHVAEKKIGRHRRRSTNAGAHGWVTAPCVSQPGQAVETTMDAAPARPATGLGSELNNLMTMNGPIAVPPLGSVIASATAERVRLGSLKGDWLATQIPAYAHISSLLTSSDAPAIVPVDSRRALTHAELRELVFRADGDLKSWGVRTQGSRIGIAVPNGPELMSVLLAVMDRHCAVPINPATTITEMREELKACRVVALVYQDGSESAPEMRKLCRDLNITPLALTPDANVGGGFTLTGDPYRTETVGNPFDGDCDRDLRDRDGAKSVPPSPASAKSPRFPAGHETDRVALVLHTSGSTGKKKVVPITVHQLVLGATAIAASSGLTQTDVCLNFMPLFHVGGICRNLLAPLFAGGSTVAMPFFDASDFWISIVEKQCTWYYGAPTMHMLIVNAALAAQSGFPNTEVRFVANAAGPLPSSVAIQLRTVFPGAAVLTSYGMTECMPITCPPPGYALERAGSSGQAICPDVAIVDDAGDPVAHGRVAHIVVSGQIVTHGYENDPAATTEAFHCKPTGHWFKTGDMGWMDADGYLYVTGRSKEVINRGGEIISPNEVEEALRTHPGVADVVAISVPHLTLQETVGVVVVPTKGIQEPGLRQLCQHVQDRLPPSKWPQCLILVDQIPKLASGKVSRSQIAKTLDVCEIRDGMSELDVTFEADLAATARSGRKSAATREEATARVATALSKAPGVEDTAAVIDTTGSNVIIGIVTPATVDAVKVMSFASRCLPGFLEPKDVIAVDKIPRKANGTCDSQALLTLWKGQKSARGGGAGLTPIEAAVTKAWAETLGVDQRTVGVDDDFFQVGGSSIVAGAFASDVRRTLGAALTGADIFRYRTVGSIARKIEKERALTGSGENADGTKKGSLPASMASKPLGSMAWTYHFSPTSAPSLMLQSLPLLVLAPMQKILRWCIFLNMWSFAIHALHPSVNFVHDVSNLSFISHVVRFAGVDPKNEHFHHLRLCAFFAALLFTALVSTILFPLCAVAFKWCVIGRLKPGLHPLWGQYYLRWWLCGKALEVSGPGMFGWNDSTYALFLRLMGARIGRGAKIGRNVRIADHDCLDVSANATVDDFAHLRAAEVRRGALRVAPVYVGPNATVCTRAIVGPGASIPAGATLGPYMSWRELDTRARGVTAQMEEHKKIARMRQPQPHFVSQLAAWPLVFVAEAIVWIPWVLVFVVLIRSQGLYMSIPGEQAHTGSGATAVASTHGLPFASNPAAYIKRWLGQYTGADATGFQEDGAMMPYKTTRDARDAGVSSAWSTSSSTSSASRRRVLGWERLGSQRAAPELSVERGTYSRLGAVASSQKSTGSTSERRHSKEPHVSSPDAKSETSHISRQKATAPAKIDDAAAVAAGTESIFTPPETAHQIVVDRDGNEINDEEGGGSMPQGGQVHSFYYGDPLFEALDSMTWKDCITWFMDPFRLAVIFSARIGHNIFGPLLQMAFVILVKRLVIGKFKEGPLPRTFFAREWELTRRWIMNKLLPTGNFRGAIGVIGKHYEYTSIVYRALGAKIGKRVFWPGSGVLVADGMFDLLEVGDDVVWGSRSLVFPGDGAGAIPVRIGAGGNVSDRCVLYAGATLLEDACLGSGSVAGRKTKFGVGSIWVGSRNGAAVMLDPGQNPEKINQDANMIREAKPFGRAVYQNQATYFLPPWQLMPVLFSSFIALRTAYGVVPIWVSWYVVAVITWDLGNNFWTEMAEWRYLLLLVFVYLWVHMMHTVLRFVFDTGLKWLIIGRRTPGLYPWDKSSYCLRWKIFESLCADSLHDLRFLGGSAFLPFFYNSMGSKIGRRVCLYPTGADPPMVEPDLVVIEDGACVNFAHIICHTNTLGSFALNHIVIKSGATLSTESRIMGGVVIGSDSVLLEHTLAMVGDVVEPGDIWQGWPVRAIAKAEDVAAAAKESEGGKGVTKQDAIATNNDVVVLPLAPKHANVKGYGTY